MKFVSNSISETQKAANEIYSLCVDKIGSGAVVLFLSGDLGSGKTTLTQQIAKIMNVSEHVISPTYVLVKEYETSGDFSSLVHFDAYRLEDPSEIEQLGFDELLKKKSLIVVEWPERVKKLKADVEVKCTDVDGDKVFEIL